MHPPATSLPGHRGCLDLAEGHDGPPRAAATINAYLWAVISAHRAAGHPFDRKHTFIAETWSGISRTKVKGIASDWRSR